MHWSRFERAVFLRQLALMFASGLNLFQALRVLAKQARSAPLQERLELMTRELGAGMTLSRCMERSGLFSVLHWGTVKVGESTGQLGSLLENLARVEEQEVDLERKLTARLSYPAAVLVAVLLGVAMLGHVMGGALDSLIRGLPGAAELGMLRLATAILSSPLFVLAAFACPLALGGLVTALWRQPRGRVWLETAMLGLAPLGPLWRRLQAARLCRLLAVLVSSGLRADLGLTLLGTTTTSPAAQAALNACRESLLEGSGLAAALATSGFFPPEVAQMAACGEEAGRLPQMLAKVADYCQLEVERFLEVASAALEPLLISVLGVAVGAIILMTFGPIYQLLDKL